MRDSAIFLLMIFLIVIALRSGENANISFNIITFLRPFSFAYGAIATLPGWSMFLGLTTISNLFHGNFKLKFPPFLIVFLLFLFWQINCGLFGVHPTNSWMWYQIYMISFIPSSIIIFATLNSLNNLKWVLWSMAGSIGLISFKVGFISTLKGGTHITNNIDGFVGDNNGFGLTLCLLLPILLGLRSTLKRKLFKFGMYFMLIFMGLTILYTKSRGAFLSTGIILLFGSIVSKTPIRNVLLLAILSLCGFFYIPQDYFDRMQTFQNIEEDGSAMHRIENWKVAIEAANTHPIFGVGLNNFRIYLSDSRPNISADRALVTHSTYFQVLSETGYPGLCMYLLLLLMTLISLQQTYSIANRNIQNNPDLLWVSKTAFWMRSAFIGYIFGSAFLNLLGFDGPTYFMFYANIFPHLLKKELGIRTVIQNNEKGNQAITTSI